MSTKIQLTNISVLKRYAKLRDHGANPVLGIWKGHTLMIIQSDSKGVFARIAQLLARIKNRCWETLGWLNKDPTAVTQLTNKTCSYHRGLLRKIQQTELEDVSLNDAFEELEKPNSLQILEEKIAALTEQNQQLSQELQKIQEKKAILAQTDET